MKYVAKGGEPHEMMNWKRENKTTPQNLIFKNVQQPGTRNALLKKQGWICGYTMLRLNSENECHTEHMQSQTGRPEEAINFDNFLACYPADGGAKIGFGAPEKFGKIVAVEDFVFPNDPYCENKFTFSPDGKVSGSNRAAEETVKILNLNHDDLIQKRLKWAKYWGLTSRPVAEGSPRRSPASSRQAKDLARRMMIKDADGRFEECCVAIAEVARTYAERMDKLAQRRRNQRRDA